MKTLFNYLILFMALTSLTASSCNTPFEEPEIPAERQYFDFSKTEAQMAEDVNSFCFHLFQSLGKPYDSENSFVSPFSLSLALSMTAIGADGITAQEMLNTLGFESYTVEDMNSYFQKLTEGLGQVDKKTVFEVANSIWVNPELKVYKDFIHQAEKYYASEIKTADFAKKATVDAVNQWCSDKTHGKINRILDEPDASIMMALLNALYFNGNWSFEFTRTEKGDFTDIDKHLQRVDMMHAHHNLPYAQSRHFQMVELPYGNEAFAMDILLPDPELSWEQVTDSLNSDEWKELTASLFDREVNLTLPKFKMEFDITLNDILKAMGMEKAFSTDADFSKMSPMPLAIDQVRQKTFVDVNEKGTEAAAVTIVTSKLTSIGPAHERIIDFHVDRPFIFIIRECSSQNILFIGQKLK